MSSLVEDIEEEFNSAANFIQSHHHEFSKEHLLEFYAFYKQSTVGCLDLMNNPRPAFFKIQERAKHSAWAELKSMTQPEAMTNYVELLTRLKPEWSEGLKSGNGASSGGGSFGVAVSRMPAADEIVIDESDKTIEDFLKEGNVETFRKLLADVGEEEINSLDDNGLGLIHWACDRGNVEILELILNTAGIDINLQDEEGQTALFYASSCGHASCLRLLLANKADKTILDIDGRSCLDAAYDDEMRDILK